MRIGEVVQIMAAHCNVMSRDNSGFVEEMSHEHRTIQQAFTRLCIEWLEFIAYAPKRCIDLRNQASQDMARKMLEGEAVRQDYGFPPSKHLPMI